MSRYFTLYDTTGTARYQTLATSATSAKSTAINGRRITILTNEVAALVAFGTSTVVATTASCVIPANSALDFNFVSGQYVAAIATTGTGYLTIIDAD